MGLLFRRVGAVLALVGAATAAGAQETTYHLCVIRAIAEDGKSRTVAITEPFPYQGEGMSRLDAQFEAYVSDLERGKVEAKFATSKYMDSECFAGGTDHAGQVQHLQNRLRYEPNAAVIPSPLDIMGTYQRTPSSQIAAVPRAPEPRVGTEPAPPSDKPLPDWEMKYQRELAAYQQRLKEIEALKAEREVTIAQNNAELARKKSEAEQQLEQHRREVAQANAAKRRYEEELAAHQALVERTQTQEDRNRAVEWKEAVVVCTLRQADGQSKFGNWRCDGPLQFTYAKLGQEGGPATGGALTALSEACGGRRESIRDLGLVSGYRVFGCSFGLHPKQTTGFHLDAAKKYGIEYVPGRAVYRCPAWKSFCRTT